MALRVPDATVGPFREATTAVITATLMDTADPPVAIPGSAMAAVTYTLYSEADPFDIINSRDHVDILANVDSDGLLTLELTPDDNLMVDEDELTEYHRLLLEWTYNSTRQGNAEIRVVVQNVLKVPA